MILFQQVVAGDTSYHFTNQANITVFDVHNDSPYNMGVSFGRDTGMNSADHFTPAHSILQGISPVDPKVRSVGSSRWTGTIYIYTQTPQGGTINTASAPASQITVIGYPAGYQPNGTVSLSRMSNIGNNVPISTSTTSLVNDGNPPATSIIEATPSDAASSTWQADNKGNLTVKSDNAGTLTTLLQLIAGASPAVKLAAATIATEILGNLLVDGTLTVTGSTSLNGGAFTPNITLTTGKIFGTGGWTWSDFSGGSDWVVTPNGGQFKINGGALNATSGIFTTNETLTGGKIFGTGGWGWIDFSDNSNFILTPNGGRFKLANNASIQFADGSLVNRIHGFSGTGSGTFNHQNGQTPNNVQLTCHSLNSSQTMGYDSEGSTTLHVTTGAGLAWMGIAFSLA